tara:strand:+ start:1006 stop:1368 length:363 start_codon:yes stop_codon:yes gene_type:complete
MSEFSRDMIENHGLQSILCLYVSDNGDINHCTSWNESKDGSLETIADVFVNLIVGDMGDKVLGFIEQQCVLQDKGDHYEKLINRLNDLTATLVAAQQSAQEETNPSGDEIVVPADQPCHI